MQSVVEPGASPRARNNVWRVRAFDVTLGLTALFVFASTLAMWVYPGGTALDSNATGYHFGINFFSDLGRTVARNRAPNAPSSALFTGGLICAGLALALFALSFATLFWNGLGQRIASAAGAATGVLSGVFFVRIALTPANLDGYAHAAYVVWAFRFFLLSALLFTAVIVRQNRYPRVYAWSFGAFTALLFGYLILIWRGPNTDTLRGLMIQVTGQKIMVYAAIISVGAQAWAARCFVRNEG